MRTIFSCVLLSLARIHPIRGQYPDQSDALEYEDWWPRPGVQPHKLVNLVNVEYNCSLVMFNTTYPPR